MTPAVRVGLAVGVAIPAYGVYRCYRRDMNAARARLAAVDRRAVSTQWGLVEYAERGSGAPVLVVHGVYQNRASGLLSVRDLFADRGVIAPSRFGYLGSSMRPNGDASRPGRRVCGSTRRPPDWPDRRPRRIPGARFVSLESGGHLMIGQHKKERDELDKFFAESAAHRAEQIAS